MTSRFSILGAGSWGTVLANLLASNGNECLLYKHAVKRYGKKNVDRLIQQDIFRKEKSNFNDDVCIYSSQIDTNIIDINHITKVKTEAANIRHYGNPEGKQETKVVFYFNKIVKIGSPVFGHIINLVVP